MVVSPVCLIHSKIKSKSDILRIFESQLSCGFPSPAEGYLEVMPSLDERLIKHPSASFLARAQGESMIERGILDGSLLVIDRAVRAKHGSTIVASIAGEMMVKIWDEKRQLLQPANRKMQPIPIPDGLEAVCEGVVTFCITPQNHFTFAC